MGGSLQFISGFVQMDNVPDDYYMDYVAQSYTGAQVHGAVRLIL
jgi:hypothetical protein